MKLNELKKLWSTIDPKNIDSIYDAAISEPLNKIHDEWMSQVSNNNYSACKMIQSIHNSVNSLRSNNV